MFIKHSILTIIIFTGFIFGHIPKSINPDILSKQQLNEIKALSFEIKINGGTHKEMDFEIIKLYRNWVLQKRISNHINNKSYKENLDRECGDGECSEDETEDSCPDDCSESEWGECTGNVSWIGDSWCDSFNNNADCDYDGGDCCAGSCDGSQDLYSCDECDADGDGLGCGDQADTDGDGRSVVPLDYNNDGRPDLIVRQVGGGAVKLYENQFPKKNWLCVSLRGVESNRLGIGARIVAKFDERQVVRELWPVNTYYSQAPSLVHLGLGSSGKVDELYIRWPSGKEQRLKGVEANRHILIRESDETEHTITPGQKIPF